MGSSVEVHLRKVCALGFPVNLAPIAETPSKQKLRRFWSRARTSPGGLRWRSVRLGSIILSCSTRAPVYRVHKRCPGPGAEIGRSVRIGRFAYLRVNHTRASGDLVVVQPFTRSLFLLTERDELEEIFRLAVERPFVLYRVSDWSMLKRSLNSAPHTAVCFADATVSVGPERGIAEGLREVVQEFPLVAVVACLAVQAEGVTVVRALQDWGVAEVFDTERECSPAAAARRLHKVKGVAAQRLVNRAFPRALSPRGRTLMERAAEIAAEGGQVPEFARVLGIYRSTVPRWCETAGLPEPRRIFAWLRLLFAADLLDDPRRSIESIARITGFASAASLKSTCRSFTSCSPSDLRDGGAFETVASLARREFDAMREAERQSRPQERWYH